MVFVIDAGPGGSIWLMWSIDMLNMCASFFAIWFFGVVPGWSIAYFCECFWSACVGPPMIFLLLFSVISPMASSSVHFW